MILLERYIGKTIFSSIALVTLMLTGLQLFILFVNQLNDLGKVDYGILQAAYFVLLQMPYQVYLFFPMASLLGCLIGLGVLANHTELVVMRAAGLSIWQVTVAVLKVSMFIVLVITLLGETVVPTLVRISNEQKMQALSGGQVLLTARGLWLRQGSDFITIGRILPDNQLEKVVQFRFNDAHRLILARKMETIRYNNGSWQAVDVAETRFYATHTKAHQTKQMTWDVPLNPKVLWVSSREPDEMTLHELRQYIRIQTSNHQAVSNYQLAYWQRIFQPLTTIVMILLAIPFIFGPLRSSTMGAKLLAGITLGFGFNMMNRFFGPISQVFHWPPMLAALGPTVLFALLGAYLMRRAR